MGKQPKLKIMVASTIYGFEDQLEQVCGILRGYGYEVWNSHLKTIPIYPDKSNAENCLFAVQSCDVVCGIIREKYGSGVVNGISITHQEIRAAIKLKKPHWLIAHRDIRIARELLKQFMFDEHNQPKPDFIFRRTGVIDDIRIIELYNDAVKNDLPVAERTGNWVDEYLRIDEILKWLETQFSDLNRVRGIVNQMNQTK